MKGRKYLVLKMKDRYPIGIFKVKESDDIIPNRNNDGF